MNNKDAALHAVGMYNQVRDALREAIPGDLCGLDQPDPIVTALLTLAAIVYQSSDYVEAQLQKIYEGLPE